MADQRNNKYDVERKTYTYRNAGLDEKGEIIWERDGDPKSKVMKNTNFNEIKKDLYDKGSDAGYVKYKPDTYSIRKQPRKLDNVTKYSKDGMTKTITTYLPVRKAK